MAKKLSKNWFEICSATPPPPPQSITVDQSNHSINTTNISPVAPLKEHTSDSIKLNQSVYKVSGHVYDEDGKPLADINHTLLIAEAAFDLTFNQH
jgi:hypothetical protein